MAAKDPFLRAREERKKREAEQSGMPSEGFEAPANLGVTTLFKELAGIPGGLARVVTNPGQGVPALAKGILGSVMSTVSTPFAPLGKLNPVEAIGDAILGEDVVQDFGERAKNRGILPALVEDIGNVALAGTATKLSKLSQLKTAKAAGNLDDVARLGQQVEKLRAIEQPYVTTFRRVVSPAARAGTAEKLARVARAAETANLLPSRQSANSAPLAGADGLDVPQDPGTLSGPSGGLSGESGSVSTLERTQNVTRTIDTSEPVRPGYRPKAGEKARAADRDNVGTVIDVDDATGTARVHFENKRLGTAETVTMPVGQLLPPGVRPVGNPAVQAAASATRQVIEETPEVLDARRLVDEAKAQHKATAARTPERAAANQALRDAQKALAAANEAAAKSEVPVAPELADALAGQRTPPNLPEGAPARVGPVEESVRRLRSQAVDPRIAARVANFGDKSVNALSWLDQKFQGAEMRMVRREHEIFIEAARREALLAVAPARRAAAELMDQTDAEAALALGDTKKLTPEAADVMIGDEIRARVTGLKGYLDAIEAEVGALDPKTLKRLGIRGEIIPKRFLQNADGTRTDLDVMLDEAADSVRQMSDQRLSTLVGSSAGIAGLETVGSRTPFLTKAERGKILRAQRDLDRARKAAAKVTVERAAKAAEAARFQDDIAKTAQDIHRLHAEAGAAIKEFEAHRAPKVFTSPEWGGIKASLARGVLSTDLGGNGGFTFNPITGVERTPVAFGGDAVGHGVSVQDVIKVPVEQWVQAGAEGAMYGEQVIEMVARAYQEAFPGNPDLNIGGWTSDGHVYLDLSQNTIDGKPITRDQALILGAARQQEAVLDFTTGAEIAPTGDQAIASLFINDHAHRNALAGGFRSVIQAAEDSGAAIPWSQEAVDAWMNGMDNVAVRMHLANPKRFPTPDSVYKHWQAEAGGAVPEGALFQTVLATDPKNRAQLRALWNDFQKTFGEAWPKMANWYFRVNEAIEPFRGTELSLPRVADDGSVTFVKRDAAELLYDFIAVTSQNTGPRENLGYALQALVNTKRLADDVQGNPAKLSALGKAISNLSSEDWLGLVNEARGMGPGARSKAAEVLEQRLANDPELGGLMTDTHTYKQAQRRVLALVIERPLAEWDMDFVQGRLGDLSLLMDPKTFDLSAIPEESIARYTDEGTAQGMSPEDARSYGLKIASWEHYGTQMFAKYQSYRDNMANPSTSRRVTNDQRMGQIFGRPSSPAGDTPGRYFVESVPVQNLADELTQMELTRKLEGGPENPLMAELRKGPNGEILPHTIQAAFWAYIFKKVEDLDQAHLKSHTERSRKMIADGTWVPDADPVPTWFMDDIGPMWIEANRIAELEAVTGKKPTAQTVEARPRPTPGVESDGITIQQKRLLPMEKGGAAYARHKKLEVEMTNLGKYWDVQEQIKAALAAGDTKKALKVFDKWTATTSTRIKPRGGGDIRDYATHLRTPRIQQLLEEWAALADPLPLEHLDAMSDAVPVALKQEFLNEVAGATIKSGAGVTYRAMMRFFQTANVSTLVHESAHAIRPLLPEAQLRELERALGVEPGAKWSVAQEEKFAEWLEGYFRRDASSEAPKHLGSVFDAVRDTVSAAWLETRGIPEYRNLPESVQGLLDEMLDPPEVPLPADLHRVADKAVETAQAKQKAALARSAAATREAGRKARTKAILEAELKKVEDVLADKALPSQLAATRGAKSAERLLIAAERTVARPSVSRVPAHWQPIYHAVKSLIDDAVKAGDDALAESLKGMGDTLGQVIDRALENGLDPAHLPKMTDAQVRRLMFDTTRLGGKAGDYGVEVASGGRKGRAYRRPDLMDRSIAALTAGLVDAVKETQTNQFVSYIEDTIARPVEAAGGVIPKGWVAWDSHRTWILTGQDVADAAPGVASSAPQLQGARMAGTAKLMIPESVANSIRNYGKDYNHPAWNWLRKTTSPWRYMVLMLRPAFYVNNALGAMMLGTVSGGARLQDWTKAYRAYRGWRSINTADVRRQAPRILEELGTTADDVSTFARSGAPSLIETAYSDTASGVVGRGGIQGIKDAGAAAVGGRRARMSAQHAEIKAAMGRASSVMDDIARTAVTFAEMRKGTSPEHALQKAVKTMLDYQSLSNFERAVVRSAVPFYAFQREILKHVAKFPLDNPAAAGIMLALGQLNEELAVDHYGVQLPRAYRNVVPVPVVGNLNIGPIVPFADADALMSAQGIAASVGPAVDVMVRHAFGAPEGGYATEYRLGDFGRVEPTTNPVEEAFELGKFLPQARLATAPDKVSQGLRFFGVPRLADEQVESVIERTKQSREDPRLVGR